MVSLTINNPPEPLNMMTAIFCVGFVVAYHGVIDRPFKWKIEREEALKKEERKKAQKEEDDERDRVLKQEQIRAFKAQQPGPPPQQHWAPPQQHGPPPQQPGPPPQQPGPPPQQPGPPPQQPGPPPQQHGPAIPWVVPAVQVDEAVAAATRKRNRISAPSGTGEAKKPKLRDHTNPRR